MEVTLMTLTKTQQPVQIFLISLIHRGPAYSNWVAQHAHPQHAPAHPQHAPALLVSDICLFIFYLPMPPQSASECPFAWSCLIKGFNVLKFHTPVKPCLNYARHNVQANNDLRITPDYTNLQLLSIIIQLWKQCIDKIFVLAVRGFSNKRHPIFAFIYTRSWYLFAGRVYTHPLSSRPNTGSSHLSVVLYIPKVSIIWVMRIG